MEPNRIKGMVAPAFGSRLQGVVRPNQIWEIDSLNAELVLKYQCQLSQNLKVKRYSLVRCIDLFTRRAMLLLSDTSKAEAVCQLLATTILKWGVPVGAVTDSWQDEHRFRLWLLGKEMKQPVAVDPNQSLMVVFEQWSKGLEASVSKREFVAHYGLPFKCV